MQGSRHSSMGSLSGPERQDAIYKVGLLCELRRRNRPDDEIAKKLHFGSVEAMHTQLNNWGLPLWLTRDLQRSSEEATGPPQKRKRRARSTGGAEELPRAKEALPLFKTFHRDIDRALSKVVNLREWYQGGRFVAREAITASHGFWRSDYTEREWTELCDEHNQDPNVDVFNVPGHVISIPEGATQTPFAELVRLIAVYIVLDKPLEPLLDALHPNPTTDVRAQLKKIVEGETRKVPGKDGTLRTHQIVGVKTLLARATRLIRGGEVRPGQHSGELTPTEHLAAELIQGWRQTGATEQQIIEELRSRGFSKVDIARLEKIGLEPYPPN
jgi:hypothetical protein